MEDRIIRIDGKDLTSVTGSVKGILQSYVRNTHKYDNAEIDTHRREGTILVKGVPLDVIHDGMQLAQSKLLPNKRFTYTVEAPAPEADADPDAEALEARMETRYVKALEIQRKEFENQIAGYEGELRRLTSEGEDLRRKVNTLNELRRQDQDQLTSLKKSYDEVSRLLESVTEERTRSPLDVSDAWVGDWSIPARQMDQRVADAAGDGWPDIEPLLAFDLERLRASVREEAALDAVPEDVEAMERIANASSWEETEEYGSLRPAYEKAKGERDYIEALEAGEVAMPDALKQTLLAAVDRPSLDAAIRAYEEAERVHSERTAASNRIMELVDRFRRAESLRALLGGREQRIPVAVLCKDTEDGFWLEAVIPRSDGTAIRPTLEQMAHKAVNGAAERAPEVVVEDAVVRVGARMSGKYKEWKDASRQQEEACLALAKSFKDSPLSALGFRLNMVKAMGGPDT